MKNSIFKSVLLVALIILTLSYSCNKDLSKPAPGALSAGVLATKAGVDGLLIGTYALLDMNSGVAAINGITWGGAVSNWHFGGIASDDANKGSNPTDQPDAASIMNHSLSATNAYVRDKWAVCYDGIQRANDVLRELPLVKDGSVTPEYAAGVTAEARFLRGVFELELAKVFRNVPYVDETVTYVAGNYVVPNTTPIWPHIEADFIAAFSTLPAVQVQVGRANKFAAEAFLAKTYMFEHKYAPAQTALNDLITKGVTSQGVKYALVPFNNNFDAAFKNGPESVFAVQSSVQDQAQGQNGNPGDVLNFPAAGPATCCGFYQPSFSLVNSFKVDPATGLPLFNTFDDVLLKSDQAVKASDSTYLPDSVTPLDPRLDWTAGRRGIPFLDWGIMPGASWARAQGDAGPYINVKNIYRKAQAATASDAFQGWAAGQSDAVNFNMIRFADVLLWAAEVEVEIGSQAQAETYVNRIRARAADPTNWVMGRLTGYGTTNGKLDASKPIVNNTLPAANYQIGLYKSQIATGSKDFARQAIWFERKLELAMEGMRFFDLQRYDGLSGGPAAPGYMATTLNAYIKKSTSYDPKFFANSVLQGATFTQGKNEIYPIPQRQIDREGGQLKQNPGGY